jgi:hypothetical protein
MCSRIVQRYSKCRCLLRILKSPCANARYEEGCTKGIKEKTVLVGLWCSSHDSQGPVDKAGKLGPILMYEPLLYTCIGSAVQEQGNNNISGLSEQNRRNYQQHPQSLETYTLPQVYPQSSGCDVNIEQVAGPDCVNTVYRESLTEEKLLDAGAVVKLKENSFVRSVSCNLSPKGKIVFKRTIKDYRISEKGGFQRANSQVAEPEIVSLVPGLRNSLQRLPVVRNGVPYAIRQGYQAYKSRLKSRFWPKLGSQVTRLQWTCVRPL